MLAAAVVVLAGFVVYQLRRRRSGPYAAGRAERASRSGRTRSGVLFVIVFFGSIVGFSLSVGLFLQLGLGLFADAGEPDHDRLGGRRVPRLRLRARP